MEIGQEIRRLRKAKKMTLEQLAHEVGTDTGNLSRLERGTQGYTEELLRKIAAGLGVKLYQLYATAEGVDLSAGYEVENPAEIKEALRIKEELIFVPRYNVTASMGPGAVVDSEQVVDYLSFKRSWIEREHFNADKLALINSRGDSMTPTINPGDLLLIDHSPIDRLANGIYVLNIEGDLLAKRVERQLDGSIRIISDNPKYPPQVITDEDAKKLTVVGKVVWAGGRM